MNNGQSPLGGQQFVQNTANGQAGFGSGNTMIPQNNVSYSPLPQNANSQFVTIGDGVDDKKKKKRIIVISVVALVFVAILLVLIILLSNNRNSSNKNTSGEKGLKESFNSYINYVVYGEDSVDDVDDSTIYMGSYYNNGEFRKQSETYLSTADSKFKDFSDYYYSNDGDEDVGLLAVYFNDFIRVRINEDDVDGGMLGIYNSYGESGVIEMINKSYDTDYNDVYLSQYVTFAKKFSENNLSVLKNMRDHGCLNDGLVVENCYSYTQEEKNNYNDAILKKIEAERSMRNRAGNVYLSVYSKIYGESDEKEARSE